ncbi:MAG TPA: DNA repair protein RecN [Candidatus Baltobacteraceae bacterium]|nr:DNA repair protein RecN [Candidatus Baltobacteraceae bacterium]
MLRRLEIEDYGLIARADVEFADGATIFTGETGSGKTMLLGALEFALGARAGSDIVRRGSRKASVTVIFEPDETLRARLAQAGFELDDGEAGSIAREVNESGRSTLRINGRPSAAAYAREIGDAIAEIVGQHEAQRLLSPGYHLELLDRFAGEKALRLGNEVAAAHARLERAREALDRLATEEDAARQRYDDAVFAVREIDDAKLEPGEVERSNERRGYLDNVERIATALSGAREALAGEEGGATASLGAASAALSAVAKFGGDLREMAERIATLQGEAGDLTAEVARALEAAEYDPAELEALNARLERLERLQRKYGDSLEGVLAYAERARGSVDEYENRDRLLAQRRAEVEAATHELERAAAALSALRRKAARTLSERVRGEFGEIALGSGRFEISFEALAQIGARGAERVDFLFAANAGEPARALARVASGGELSRVLLALVVALAQARDAGGALVFDEIDAGIGGATATAVGARVGELAEREQVVCVTHLAQLATWADRHYVLDKIERKNETTIAVRELRSAKEREAEIARMLSGEPHEIAVRHARALLQAAQKA